MKEVLVLLMSVSSCAVGFRIAAKEGEESGRPGRLGPTKQYTPNQANWSEITRLQQRRNPGGHDPRNANLVSRGGDIYPVGQDVWNMAKWDGRTYNPTQMTKKEFYNTICPQFYIVRGMREVFERERPFRDNRNPTKAEIDYWHTLMLNHIRALVGYTESNRQARPDGCLHARALWAEQRRFSKIWDSKYPSDSNGAPPCGDPKKSNSHCGATFIPNATEQRAYLPSGPSSCTRNTPAGGNAEGIFYTRSSESWSIKWARSFCQTLRSEGFWGSHTNPWFHRELFGFSFQHAGDQQDVDWWNQGGSLRAKWSGNLMPSKFNGNYRPG